MKKEDLSDLFINERGEIVFRGQVISSDIEKEQIEDIKEMLNDANLTNLNHWVEIDFEKVKTLEDVINILKSLDMRFEPNSKTAYFIRKYLKDSCSG